MQPQKQRRRLRFLITAGGTREYIDPVRFISNASSGKMGYELAWAANLAGYDVTLISAVTGVPLPKAVRPVEAVSAEDMFAQVKNRFRACDCLIMAAAVSDYTPVKKSKVKIKKAKRTLTVRLKPTVDILAWAGAHKKRNQIVVGFALEDRNLRASAEKKLRGKNLDMIVANRPEAIGQLRASAEIKTAKGQWLHVRRTGKRVIADKIIRLIEKIWQK